MKTYNENSLINFSNSFLKHFGAPTFHDSIKEIDDILKNNNKVVVLLFDGMGQNIIRHHLKEKSYIRSHYVTTINSTLPPTTTAATTSFLTGKYPIETGWLSWAQYFKDYDKNIILFRNIDYNTDEKIEEGNIANKYFPNKTILDLINENNPSIKTYNVSRYPVNQDGPKELRHAFKAITKIEKKDESSFMYFYWNSPDWEMHDSGIYSFKTHHRVKTIDRFIKRLVKKNPNTLFISFADHGHINAKYLDICDHDDLYSCLSNKVTLEKRLPSFFVKEEKKSIFAELFNKYYGEYFELLTKEDAIECHLFGLGDPRNRVVESFGDYIAISKTEYSLYASKEMKHLGLHIGHHAGGTDAERLIDVSAFKAN